MRGLIAGACFVWCSCVWTGPSPAADDALTAWRTGVTVRPVATTPLRHSIHAYFTTSPESPDGRWVLFYSSASSKGHTGDLRVVERATGAERVIATDIEVEDAHRAACQQWAAQGLAVAFHDVRQGQWLVCAVDFESGHVHVLVRDRQLGFGTPGSNLVPVYGCHWNPGEHRDLEMVDVTAGGVRTALTAAAVQRAYPEWIERQFGQRPVSIFFPVLSRDGERVFFKMATPGGGDFRSSKASTRLGLVCYDLAQEQFLFLRSKWGHPVWHPDSRTILEANHELVDTNRQGAARIIPGLPRFPGTHPSVSPDGRLFVTDTQLEPFGGQKGQWGIVVGAIEGNHYTIIHRFDNSRGARSWRRSHPHPVFSPDGKRIYFNVNSTDWTQLHVAQRNEN